jgi:biopolymer transport protein ExbD
MAFLAARENPMADMNITPLVDVMLVLLVIFMIAAPTLTRTLSLTLPHPVDPPPPPSPELTIQVQAGDMYTLDGQPMTQREIGNAVRSALATTPDVRVTLDVDPSAEYASAMTAMATVRNEGVDAIAVIAH